MIIISGIPTTYVDDKKINGSGRLYQEEPPDITSANPLPINWVANVVKNAGALI